MSQTIPAGQLLELKLTDLKPATDNPRRDVGDVTELAESIKALGILEPILAMQQNGHYLIVAGARRYAAAKKAGLKTVQVIVREFDEKDRIAAMLVENLQRHDLTVMEEAGALRRLIDDCGMTQRDLAVKVGRSQAHISKRLTLLELPDDIIVLVDSGGITIGDAVELAKLKAHPEHLKDAAFGGSQWQDVSTRVSLQLERIEREKKIKAREEELESQAIATVRVPNDHTLPKGVFKLAGDGYSYDALPIKAAKHGESICHAIAITDRGNEFPVCTDRKNHPKARTLREKQKDGTPPTRDAKQQELKQQALDAAADRRMLFVGELVRRKGLAKAELLDVLVAGYIDRAFELADENLVFACIGLGLVDREDDGDIPITTEVEGLLRSYQERGEAEALRLAAALMLGEVEGFEISTWRGWSAKAAEYLAFLERHGYEISDVEREQLPKA